MGITALLVRRHISRLKDGEIFTTRDLLGYGKRNNIDNLTYRLVKKGDLQRLAFGVFCRSWISFKPATAIDIAKAKMRAWGKRIWIESPIEKRLRRGQTEASMQTESELVFSVSGSSSEFKTYLGVKIVLRARGQRRMKLGDTAVGRVARETWNSGKDSFNASSADDLISRTPRADRTDSFSQFRLLPAWMTDLFDSHRLRHFGPSIAKLGLTSPD